MLHNKWLLLMDGSIQAWANNTNGSFLARDNQAIYQQSIDGSKLLEKLDASGVRTGYFFDIDKHSNYESLNKVRKAYHSKYNKL